MEAYSRPPCFPLVSYRIALFEARNEALLFIGERRDGGLRSFRLFCRVFPLLGRSASPHLSVLVSNVIAYVLRHVSNYPSTLLPPPHHPPLCRFPGAGDGGGASGSTGS